MRLQEAQLLPIALKTRVHAAQGQIVPLQHGLLILQQIAVDLDHLIRPREDRQIQRIVDAGLLHGCKKGRAGSIGVIARPGRGGQLGNNLL